MNYWMTTHWPPNGVVDLDDFQPEGVYLPSDRVQAGADIEVGDKVLIYQSKTGRPEIRNIKGELITLRPSVGKEGIIAIVEIVGELMEIPDSRPTKYADGSEVWWRWHADTELISTNGFVPRADVNRVLNYKPNNTLRAFGDYKSGLKKLEDKDKFFELVQIFNSHPRKIDTIRKAKKSGSKGSFGEGGESKEHRVFKEFVASNPSAILGEQGLETIKMEYPFITGDRADIVLKDAFGRMIGAEIEISVEDQITGILQAIKYRYMLALVEERKNYETRAFLIAKSISRKMREICDEYEVECFEVDEGGQT